MRSIELRHLVVVRHLEKHHRVHPLVDDGAAVHSDSPVIVRDAHLRLAKREREDTPNRVVARNRLLFGGAT